MSMDRVFMVILGFAGALAVGLGAFGAHALEARLSADAVATFETAVRYQFYHVVGLLAVVVAIDRWPAAQRLSVWSGWLFVVGMVIFSGSLYLLVATGIRWLGAITPIGGVAFIVGWIMLAVSAWRGR
jgi:uncharacterized membrane protein YgdD (TMEM256/DUF423 family)